MREIERALLTMLESLEPVFQKINRVCELLREREAADEAQFKFETERELEEAEEQKK